MSQKYAPVATSCKSGFVYIASCPQTLPTVVFIDIIAILPVIQSNISNLSMDGC